MEMYQKYDLYIIHTSDFPLNLHSTWLDLEAIIDLDLWNKN